MSSIARTVIEIPINELKGVDHKFGRLTKFNMKNIPEKFKDEISKTREFCFEDIRPMCVIQSIGIKNITDEEVELEDGSVLHGTLPPVLLAESSEVIAFVTTLRKRNESVAAEDSMISEFFVDAWSSAIISSADSWLLNEIRRTMRKKGLFATISWCPGQNNFPMINQRNIFEILKPEELGVQLTKSYMISPVKSVAGIVGLARSEDTRRLNACNFCDLKDNCPSNKSDSCYLGNEFYEDIN